jgi:hypothetical protein
MGSFMSINPNGAPPGYYYQAGATAYTIDPAGTYSVEGATAPTLDGAGTYSLAGASTPTADPGGTYSAAGASAPTQDPAGTYSSPYALDTLFLETSSATPNNEVLSFNSVTAVANYYGNTSAEAGLATQFFADYGTAANMLFIRFPIGGNRAHLYGGNVSNLTLAQLQAINGNLKVTSQGYQYSATINLAGVTSFTAAATAIQAALNENLPVAAVTTGDTITPESVSFTASANGLLLDVTSIAPGGSIEIGALISGAGVPAGTQINAQFAGIGTPGGVGLYSLYVPAGQISSEAMTESYGMLTVGSVSSGTVADGEQLTDTSGDLLPDTAIEANLSGSGPGSTWVVNNSEAVSSETMTMTGAPLSVLYTPITGATQNSGYFSIQQNGDFNYASASLTYASGAAAALLDLTQNTGAWLQTPGTNITSEAAFMSNLVATLTNKFGSFQSTWSQLAQEDPALQTELEDWAQSTDGQFQFLENNTTNASPAGTSLPTTDPAGTYSGPGASAPTLAPAGTYIPVTGATSTKAEKVDPAGTYSPAGASAATTDPAGTYSGARASAPTLAAAGTYIPGSGATSSAAEVPDPAGFYCPAGASAPILDPAGTYSGAGASAPTLAAAGTYIPVTGATSSAAEVTDLAGSYSLAGASAPTLAQPGYYVATTGASSETPVSTGYYTWYAGATSETPAQPLTISGTVAGQTVAPLENDTPFSSVEISDPNTGTTDTLTIELSGGGGLLSDGAGFDGLTTSGSGVYLLTGTAAAITAELDALIFAPSASTTPTTFDLTDTSTAGTSANNTNTTVTVGSTPVVLSVATFLGEESTLNGDVDILDTAADITASLNPLELGDSLINSITVLDSGEIGPSVQQLTSDVAIIGELQNANSSPVLLAINDTAAHIEAGLSTLVAETSNIASITVSGSSSVAVSVATFLADQSTLDKIVGGFDISDSAADVANSLNALNADLNVSSIVLTDEGVPTLSVSLAEAENDTRALDEIASPHAVDIADSAPATITSTEAIYLSSENIAVNGAAVIATGTVATMAILAQIETSLLESQGYTLAVLDTAANIEGLTQAQIANLSLRGVLLLEASDTSVALTASLAVSLEAADMTVTAPSGSEVTLTAPKASVSNLTPATIAGLPALGVTAIVSTNGSVTVDVAQALALEGADLGITVPSGDSVTLTDLASNLAALTPSQIDALAATGVSGATVSNGANLALSAADAQALEASNLEISGGFDVSDSAANVAANIDALNGDANVTSILLTDGGTPALSLDVQALKDTKALGEIVSPYTIAITDTTAHINADLAAINTLIGDGQVSSLTTTDVTGQPYSSYEQLFDDGVSSGTDYFYTNVTGESYSSYEYDYSAGDAVTGSKFYYTGITGQAYTGEEVDYNGAGQLTRTAFTGLGDPAYSSYQYNYVGGVSSGSEFTFTTVPTGAAYSSYEVDFNQAGNFTGDQFFFTNIQGQFFTGEEVNLDASGALSSVLLTGIADEAYSSLELDYSAGTYEGYQAFYTGITGQAYTSEEVDVSAAGQLEKIIYSGMTSTPYSSDEVDYSGGAVSDVIYNYTNVTGQPYYADQVEVTPGGAGLQETLDLNSGGHDLIAMATGQTLTSLSDDTMTGSGSTTFVLNAVYGADTIANLTGSDIVSMPTSEFANFTTLSGAASFATGAAVITASDGDTLTLDGIATSAQLKSLSGDFTFHS